MFIIIEAVNGPTPPGTGVPKNDAFLAYSHISPHSFPLKSRLTPISIATPPALRAVMMLGLPTAEITISASAVILFKSYLLELHRVTVAFRLWSI